MENTPMREEHERLLERCRENPLVLEALGEVFDACGDLVATLIQAMADMEEADERDKG